MTHQVPPYRLPESAKPEAMTLKQEIERVAGKLGAAVRSSAEEFARATGLRPDINVDWLVYQQVGEQASGLLVSAVRVEVGGLSVEA